jgi:multiple sugar transport system substrate-binding protein
MSGKRMTRRTLLGTAFLGALASVPLLQACGGQPAQPTAAPAAAPTTAPAAAGAKPTEAPKPAAQAPAPTPAAAAASKTKYQGKELRYAGLGSMGEAVEKMGGPWMAERGVKMNRGAFGQQELEEKILQAMATNSYFVDLVQFNSNSSGDVMGGGWLLEVPKEIKSLVDMEDVFPLYRDRLLSWNGKQYALPYDGDKHMHVFRGDLFANADNQAKFKAKFGYEMDPKLGPKTWEERRQYAEFFSGWDWNKSGKNDEAGFADMTARKDTLWWGFMSRASSYVKHPDDTAVLFDLDTFEPRINNPAFVRAVTEWKEELEKFSLPGGTNLKWGESGPAYRGGLTAMSIGWWGVAEGDPASTKPEVIKGTRYSILPGSKEVYNAKAKKWDSIDKINYAPFIAFGGWVLAVPKNSKEPDLAFEFGSYIASREKSLEMVTNPTGAQPFRYSHLSNIADWTERNMKLDKDWAASYLAAEKATIEHPNVMLDLRIPGFTQYRDAGELSIAQALTGEKAPQAAMDACAAAWKEITNRVGGAGKQKDLYAASMALK